MLIHSEVYANWDGIKFLRGHLYKTTGIKWKLMPLEFLLYLSQILCKLFFKWLQIVKTEQQPSWEMIQASNNYRASNNYIS